MAPTQLSSTTDGSNIVQKGTHLQRYFTFDLVNQKQFLMEIWIHFGCMK